jgi:hypothetical protein
MITEADIEALELLVKSGKVAPQANWKDAIPEVRAYIIGLAKRLETEEKPTPG